MNDFFGTTPLSQQDLQARLAQRRSQNGGPSRTMSMSMLPQDASPQTNDGMAVGDLMGGDSLDDIIMQNDMEIQRRQSMPQGFQRQEPDHRSSMMEFGSSDGNLNGFQFGVPTSAAADAHMRRQSAGELDMRGAYQDLNLGMGLPGQQMGFSSSMEPSNSLILDTSSSQYGRMSGDMGQHLMGYGSMGLEGMSEEEQAISMFSSPTFPQGFPTGSIDGLSNEFMLPHQSMTEAQLQSPNTTIDGTEGSSAMMPALSGNASGLAVSESDIATSPRKMVNQNHSVNSYRSPATSNPPTISRADSTSLTLVGSATTPAAPTPAASAPVKPEPNYNGIYSSSGFDMLGILMKVATRKNPEIDIGKVDMSCAFVVCDVTMPDCPIVYVSDIFERLTGYNKFEVTGQNCRFLQSPEGKVQPGLRREFVDNDSVYYLKNRIADKREAQRSLINYRKGGQPFMNLLTMIPICGEDSDEIKYFVGFQVDLVEKPTSVEGKNASGTYTVDYSQGQLPRYVWSPPESLRNQSDAGQTISRDDVSTVLSSISNHSESELTKRMWDKVLLENTDDVVHVLSLKGLFLYLSPSCRHVLEYDSSELVGTALSSVCHPSDIVPVTRELKDTSTGASVNVVFRIRRKRSGYTWFESHGSLCVEQGKGRKCIILVGRERPVYALARHDVEAAGGIGESEMWTKLSTSGMFLFVSSNVRTLLDRMPDDLVGTSIQVLMREASKVAFGRSLEKARRGHESLNKRGLELQAQTTLYPGDAAEGSKPTFLVAQTRLLKSRSVLSATHGSSTKSITSIQTHSELSTPLNPPSGMSSSQMDPEQNTPGSTQSLGPVTQAGGGGLAIGSQDLALASEDNIFSELKTTRCTSWQFELRDMEKKNRSLAEELAALLSSKKKRKRRKGAGPLQRDCANCHTRVTPEWRRGPSGNRDLCNSCGLRWAKQVSRSSSETNSIIRRATRAVCPSHTLQHLEVKVCSMIFVFYSSPSRLLPHVLIYISFATKKGTPKKA
jgi:PAS domain-containing protein